MKDDTISRAAALDALGERPVVWSDNDDYTLGERNQYDMDRLAIETVPSVSFENHDEIKSYSKDTISREAAVKALEETKQSDPFNRYEYQNIGIDWSIDAIKALPSAQRWIPVTERLPEYGTTVLTCNHDGEYEINHIIDEEDGEWFLNGAVAWMPIPAPYHREGGQDGV